MSHSVEHQNKVKPDERISGPNTSWQLLLDHFKWTTEDSWKMLASDSPSHCSCVRFWTSQQSGMVGNSKFKLLPKREQNHEAKRCTQHIVPECSSRWLILSILCMLIHSIWYFEQITAHTTYFLPWILRWWSHCNSPSAISHIMWTAIWLVTKQHIVLSEQRSNMPTESSLSLPIGANVSSVSHPLLTKETVKTQWIGQKNDIFNHKVSVLMRHWGGLQIQLYVTVGIKIYFLSLWGSPSHSVNMMLEIRLSACCQNSSAF